MNIDFYEALGVDVRNRINAWRDNHHGAECKTTVYLSQTAWMELLNVLPYPECANQTTRKGELRLYGGIRCVRAKGKWTKPRGYTIKIKNRLPRRKQTIDIQSTYGMNVMAITTPIMYDPKA